MRVRRTQKEKRIARHFGGEEIFDMRSAFFVQTFFSPLTPLFEKLFQQQKNRWSFKQRRMVSPSFQRFDSRVGLRFLSASSKILIPKKDGIGELMKFLQVL